MFFFLCARDGFFPVFDTARGKSALISCTVYQYVVFFFFLAPGGICTSVVSRKGSEASCNLFIFFPVIVLVIVAVIMLSRGDLKGSEV